MLLDAADAGYNCGLDGALYLQTSIGLLLNADHMMGRFISYTRYLDILLVHKF